jgi:segregation and condensation protein A
MDEQAPSRDEQGPGPVMPEESASAPSISPSDHPPGTAEEGSSDSGEPSGTPESDDGADSPLANPEVQEEMEDPVEILVGLAERGEIDPWNINIIEVTDRFLAELDRRRQLNLRLSGRTLFYAATLIRLKSEQLVIIEPPEVEEGDGEDLFGEEFGAGTPDDIDYTGRLGPIERLEHEIQRRLDRKNMRKSPITLFELISELKNIEKEERRRRRMADGSGDLSDVLLIDADDVVSIAHEEGFQESSMVRLAEYLEGLEIDEEMTLSELCERMDWGIPEVFIPLLFLALEGRCTLRQEEFYGDIWVQICHPEKTDAPAVSAAE